MIESVRANLLHSGALDGMLEGEIQAEFARLAEALEQQQETGHAQLCSWAAAMAEIATLHETISDQAESVRRSQARAEKAERAWRAMADNFAEAFILYEKAEFRARRLAGWADKHGHPGYCEEGQIKGADCSCGLDAALGL